MTLVSRGPLGVNAPARRAVVRWTLRMFRREWRQQLLVLSLITLAVALSVAGAAAGYNAAPLRAGEFGTADLLVELDGSDPEAMDADIAAIEGWFGTVDTIGRRDMAVPGSVERVELRAQDPDGPYSGPMLGLREGRYPAGGGEVALTDAVAADLGADVGAHITLGDTAWTVVGVVENPSNLGDEFALIQPSAGPPPQSVTMLLRPQGDVPPSFWDLATAGRFADRGQTESGAAAAGVLAVASVAMVLVCLVAAAGFVVIAQRRLQQLGMLAAVGATERHLRGAMVANGVVVGAAAAAAGTLAGLAAWAVVAPRFESVVDHRIDRFALPWWLVAAGSLLAVTTATAAAWWPSRALSRIPVTEALSGRPPRPTPAHRSAVLAGIVLAVGLTCLAIGIDVPDDRSNALLVIVGVVAVPVALLLVSPLAVRAPARWARRLPFAARLAVRDLARYQARSGAALAAISLALGIPVAIIIAATAAEHRPDEGNLSDRQALVRIRDGGTDVALAPERTADEIRRLDAQVARMAAAADDAAVFPLDMAVDPEAGGPYRFEGQEGGRWAVSLDYPVGEDTYRVGVAYVATPALLEHYGIAPDAVDPSTDVFTARSGEFLLSSGGERSRPQVATNVERLDIPAYSEAPITLITQEAMRRHGWEPLRAGWLVEGAQRLTGAQRAELRDIAAGAGLTIETRQDERQLPILRSAATVVGILLALGIVAMTVGLVRSEATGDLRTLAATGAPSGTRRTITAATTGTLALLGAALGTAGAYAALAAGYRTDIGALARVPVPQLLAIGVGLPLVAGLAGWLLAGREPPTVARRPIE
jgi:putative ABC transport system permease protein